MLVFALNGSDLLGRRVAQAGRFALAPHEEREFDGGEHKSRPLVSVRGRDVYVIHTLRGGPEGSANDRLVRLLFFLAACRDNGARRVTAVAPYLAYSRKDRQTKPRDPVTTRYVAQILEAAGAEMVMTLDAHNLAAFQNAFRCRTLHLATDRLFAAAIAARAGKRPVAVVSPDPGGVKRAQLLREALEEVSGREAAFAFMEKRRSSGVVTGTHFAGDVEGRAAWIVDDMICGGGTLLRAAKAAKERGAVEVHAIATHGLFTGDAAERLADGPLDSVTVTDSAAPFAAPIAPLGRSLRVLSCAPLIAQAILAAHEGRAFGDEPVPPVQEVDSDG